MHLHRSSISLTEPPVTCAVPRAPSIGSVSTSGQSYTEGSEVTYQCNDGLFPMGVLSATCTRNTSDGQNGVWEPDPGAVVCRISPGSVIYLLNVINCCLHSQLLST